MDRRLILIEKHLKVMIKPMPTKNKTHKNPSSINLNSALKTAFAAVDKGRTVLQSYFGEISKIEEKSQMGLVTEADKESEAIIIKTLRKDFPNVEILGEESSYAKHDKGPMTPSSGGRWMIDPLDGTTNYVHQFPMYCISLALEVDGERAIGVVDVPMLNTRYWAVRGQGAFKNGKPIHVSRRKRLHDSLLATGFSSYDKPGLKKQIAAFGEIMKHVRGIRRAGSAALDMCWVAEGVFDCYWEKNLQPWDTAAGEVLVREAGGIVTSYTGLDYNPYMSSVVAGNKTIHKRVSHYIKSC
jgi:myo-inositol-1(or 4)-monophosphatase